MSQHTTGQINKSTIHSLKVENNDTSTIYTTYIYSIPTEYDISPIFRTPEAREYLSNSTQQKINSKQPLTRAELNQYNQKKFKIDLSTPVTLNALATAGYQPTAIQEAQSQDESTKPLYDFLVHNKAPNNKDKTKVRKLARQCFVIDNIVYRKGGIYNKQLVVPTCLQSELLASFHDAPWSGHYGVSQTLHRLAKHYWWPGMSTSVYTYVRACNNCQMRNIPPNMTIRQPAIHDTIPKLFERLSIDIQGEFTKSAKGNKFIVTFICLYSRWTEVFAVKAIQAITIAKLLVEEIILRYGPIQSLSSDRADNLIGNIIRETCKLFRVNKIDIAAYHPEANAHVERVHRVYNDAISKYLNAKQDNWDVYLPYIQWAYRTAKHSETGATPYELVFGRDPPDFADFTLLTTPSTKVPVGAREWISTLKERLKATRKHAEELAQKQKEKLLANSTTAIRTFNVGDKVLIRNHVKLHGTKTNTKTQKWQPRFIGPYKITERYSQTQYLMKHLGDPHDLRVRSIDDIKRYYEQPYQSTNVDTDNLTLIGETNDWDTIDQVEEKEIDFIHGKRYLQSYKWNNQLKIYYLVRYKNKGPESDEWLPEDNFLHAKGVINDYEAKIKANNIQIPYYKETKTKRVTWTIHSLYQADYINGLRGRQPL